LSRSSVHNPLLALFGRKRKMLRMDGFHFHRNANDTTARGTENIPEPFVLYIIQEIRLIIDFKLQFWSPSKSLLRAFLLALGLFARLNVFFPPKAVRRPLDFSPGFGDQLKECWLDPDRIQSELLLYGRIIVDL